MILRAALAFVSGVLRGALAKVRGSAATIVQTSGLAALIIALHADPDQISFEARSAVVAEDVSNLIAGLTDGRYAKVPRVS